MKCTKVDKHRIDLYHAPMTKIAHFADLQLGFSNFDGRYSRDREQDFYETWLVAAREAAERGVDVVVLSGDIYECDGSRKNPVVPAAYVAFRQGIDILRQDDIPVLAVSGNHDTPRVTNVEHPLSVVEAPNLTVATDHSVVWGVNRVDIDFCLIPWQHEKPFEEEDFGDADICVVHAPCSIIDPHYGGTRQFNPEVAEKYQYVALGDWHGYKSVAPNAYYSGSLERTAFGQVDAQTGGIFVTIGSGGVSHEHWAAPSRPMCQSVITEDPNDQIEQILESVDPTTMLRVVFDGVDPVDVSNELLARLRKEFLFFKESWKRNSVKQAPVTLGPAISLEEQWVGYCSDLEVGPDVQSAGVEVLQELRAE